MAHAAADLRSLITGSTAITALVSTRVHYNLVPHSSIYPRIWFRVTSDTEDRTMDGVGGMHEARADIECAGLTEDSAQNVADAVKTRLDGYTGSMGSSVARGIFLRDKADEYERQANQSDEGVHIIAFTAQIWYTT
jgi:hypothetical protein